MADQAIEWVRNQKAVAPDKPFFLYYARAPRTLRITQKRSG